jgi:hypothetical protein
VSVSALQYCEDFACCCELKDALIDEANWFACAQGAAFPSTRHPGFPSSTQARIDKPPIFTNEDFITVRSLGSIGKHWDFDVFRNTLHSKLLTLRDAPLRSDMAGGEAVEWDPSPLH